MGEKERERVRESMEDVQINCGRKKVQIRHKKHLYFL